MFGAKPAVGSKPIPAVLKRFQEKADEAGQSSFTPSYGSKNTATGPPQANGGPLKAALKPKPVATPAVPGKSATDQNQNVTNVSPNKRGSLTIPSAFQSGTASKERKVSIDEKSTQNGSPSKPATLSANNNDSTAGKFDFRANLKSASNRPTGTPKKVDINPRQREPSAEDKPLQPPAVTSPGFGNKTSATSPGFGNKTSAMSPGFGNKTSATSPGFGNKTSATSPGFGNKTPPSVSDSKSDQNKATPSPEKKPGVSFAANVANKPTPLSKGVPSFNKRITPLKTIVTRTDGKKFERLAKSTIITTELAPIKPLKPKNVNVKEIIEEYKKAFEEFKYANEELYDDVGNFIKPEEEFYDDVGNTVDRRTSARLSGRPVSEIPEWTEEEELASGGSTSVPLPVLPPTPAATQQEEFYDDGTAVEESDELYEPLPDEEPEPEGENSVIDKKEQERLEKEAAEKRKKEEHDRKVREKKEKQEQAKREKEERANQEKERKLREKKEKEEKELRKKLKLIGDEVVEAQGVVKDKQKGGKLDLALSAGQSVEIIRMTNNPKGKWLVRDDEGHLGYVDSSNITIDTTTIRQQTADSLQE